MQRSLWFQAVLLCEITKCQRADLHGKLVKRQQLRKILSADLVAPGNNRVCHISLGPGIGILRHFHYCSNLVVSECHYLLGSPELIVWQAVQKGDIRIVGYPFIWLEDR